MYHSWMQSVTESHITAQLFMRCHPSQSSQKHNLCSEQQQHAASTASTAQQYHSPRRAAQPPLLTGPPPSHPPLLLLGSRKEPALWLSKAFNLLSSKQTLHCGLRAP